MQLHSRIFGNGTPLVILHGLFGMSDNWLTVGRQLAALNFRVHIPDLRNHGRSPHSDSHRYTDMVDDLIDYLDSHRLDTVNLIGHSMGGKVAMITTLLHPERIRRLVVVDIAPVDYRQPDNTFHQELIATLQAVVIARFRERGEIRAELEAKLLDHRLAGFLAKNITRDHQGHFSWRFNLEVLERYLQHLYIGLEELSIHAPSPVPALFITGGDSPYYLPSYDQERRFFFPDSTLRTIADAGHWVHSEQPERFLHELLSFLGP